MPLRRDLFPQVLDEQKLVPLASGAGLWLETPRQLLKVARSAHRQLI